MEQHNNATHQACAACKHQRKRCNEDCILARYFPAKRNQEFQAVHKVFGVANVSKLIKSVNDEDRNRTAESLVWEAMCRQKDPILGSYGVYKQIEHKLHFVTKHYLRAQQQIQDMQWASKRIPPSLVGINCKMNDNVGLMDDRALANHGGTMDNNLLNYFDENGNSMVSTSPFGYPCHLQTQERWKQDKDVGVIVSQHLINGFKEEQLYNQGHSTITKSSIPIGMAQLPPKIPNWPDFGNAANMTTATTGQNPSWVDEFFDFSAARRMIHRRSVSDPVMFLETPPVRADNNEFDRFEDEQFINMFADHNVCPSFDPSNPSTSSDNNSGDGDKILMPNEHNEEKTQQEHQEQKTKKDFEEVQSQFKTAETGAPQNSNVRSLDPKRVRRILANRQSAQRSRVRKLQYISELERSVTTLQAEVSMMSPRVAFLDQQRLLLSVDNSALKQRIAALAQDKIFKDAAHEALTREIERLRELYHQQNLNKMESPAPSPRAFGAPQLLNI